MSLSAVVKSKWGLMVVIFLLSMSKQLYADTKHLSVKSGEVRVLDIKGVTRVAIGDPDRIGYKTLENGQIMLIGKKEGGSSVHIWRNGGREERYWINVSKSYVSSDVRLAKILTKGIADLEVYSLQGRLVIEGKVNKEDMSAIEAIKQMVPKALLVLQERAFAVKPLVRVDAVLLEIGSNDVKRLGIDWDDAISGPIFGFHKTSTAENFRIFQEDDDGVNEGIISSVPVGDNGFFQYFGITSHITSTINLLEDTGKARILSAPKLTSASGEEAKFHVGGSFPIPVINALGATDVEREDYGIILEVTPFVESDDIRLDVRVELSDIDPSVVVNGVPGTLNRRTDTTVQLRHNQTVAISGLFETSDSKGNSGLPGLSKIPILKYLFGVEESDIEDRQVVILLTPKIITPGDDADRSMSEFARGYMTEKKGYLSIDEALMD